MGHKLLTDSEASEILGVKKNTLQVWRCVRRPHQPPFIRVGRLIRYRLSDLEAWLDEQTVRIEG